ncbi:hypothetical protein RclHR1_03110022 [Rhizophagus clarus]|uniref:SAM domain-containing protein n=1 Tax=Rhizophagus clarus TaxID=94130 RepID=A0A2Z6R7C0_9GLOM|nr:hypothetical protein RclHR1_03110022 [Rhizophagus clarus]
MSSETSTPYTPASTSTTVAGNETVSLADEIKKYKTEALIEYLQKEEDLGLEEEDFEIIRKQRVNGRDFLKITEEKLEKWGMPGGPATRLADFAKDCKNKKLKAFSSYRGVGKIWYWLRWYRHYPTIFSTDPRDSRLRRALQAMYGRNISQAKKLRNFGCG